MTDQISKVEIQLLLRQAVTAEAAKVAASLKGVGTQMDALKVKSIGGALGGAAAGGLTRLLFGIAGPVAFIASLKKSISLAKDFESNQARLNIALDGNVTRFKQIQNVIGQISGAGTFGKSEVSSAAQQLVERGVPTDQLAKTLQVAADTAVSLKIPLDEAAAQIAQSFGGTLPKSLAKAVPELHNLTDASLKAGGALDVLSKAFGGQDAAFAQTEIGQLEVSTKEINEAWTDLGEKILPAAAAGMKQLVVLPKNWQDFINTPHAIGRNFELWVDSLVDKATGVIGDPVAGRPGTNLERQSNERFAKEDAALNQYLPDLELAKNAKKAIGENPGLREQFEQLDAGTQQSNRKRAEANAKIVEEEFKDRTAGLTDYLQRVDDAAGQERDRLAALAKSQSESIFGIDEDNRKKTEEDAKLQAQLTGNVDHDNKLNRVWLQLQIDINNNLRQENELKKKLADTNADLNTFEHDTLDKQVKAIEEAGKHAPGDAKESLDQFQSGEISQGELQKRVDGVLGEIDTAVDATEKHLAGMIGEGILSEDDANKILQRLLKIRAQSIDTSKAVVEYIRPIQQAQADAAKSLQKSAESEIENTLTDIETKSKSPKEALIGPAEGFIKAMLEVTNKRIAENVVGFLSGNVPGGGVFGLLGSLLNGSASSQAPSGPSTVPVQGGGGGGSGLLGFLFSAFGGAISGGIGNAIGGLGGVGGYSDPAWSIAGADSAPTSVEFGTGAGNILNLDSGGYTGDGPKHEVAGIVHKGEFVHNQETVRRIGVAALKQMGSRVSDRASVFRGGGSVGSDRESQGLLAEIRDAVQETGRRPIIPVTHISAADFEQVLKGNGVDRILAQHFKRNRETYGPVFRGAK